MYAAGYLQQTGLDVSAWVIAQMQVRNVRRRSMVWQVGDATDLTGVFEDDTFPLVVDKGTMDAVVCHEEHARLTAKYLHEAFRVTKTGGHFVCVSFRPRSGALRWLRRRAFAWKVTLVDLTKSSLDRERFSMNPDYGHGIYAYVCCKVASAAQAEVPWAELLEKVSERPDEDISSDEEWPPDGLGLEEEGLHLYDMD
eukprot:TRINITY_DN62721_c0_g1_i2.p1 TRINITY_DN62721_c0_g1~~TRINITY_DN62721_c0_g1_i2.p1  ORF type:complete len:197 (+),score=49.75 TRINITY_DN62721_c0_g1_i2:419-1009(+)